MTPPTAVSYSNDGTESVDVKSKKEGGGKPPIQQQLSDPQQRVELFKRLQFSVDLKDLRSFQCHEERPRGPAGKSFHSPWIRFVGRDGSNYVPLYFRDGGLTEFITALQRYATLKRSAREQNLILFTDEKTEALQQSVSLLFREGQQTDFFTVRKNE